LLYLRRRFLSVRYFQESKKSGWRKASDMQFVRLSFFVRNSFERERSADPGIRCRDISCFSENEAGWRCQRVILTYVVNEKVSHRFEPLARATPRSSRGVRTKARKSSFELIQRFVVPICRELVVYRSEDTIHTKEYMGCLASSVAQANLTIKVNFNRLRSFSSPDILTICIHAFL
jgi:hypothetical protein